jgi:hypothetical protein
MKTDERIIKYIENELTRYESDSFESELNNSAELKREYQKYLNVKVEVDKLRELKLNSDYLHSILPEFKNKLNAPKPFSYKRNLGYAFGVMVVFIAAAFLLRNFLSTDSEITDLQKFTQSLNETQQIELLETLNGDIDLYNLVEESKITNLIAANLQIANAMAEAYNIQYNDLVEGLSSKEIEIIYNEILKSNF